MTNHTWFCLMFAIVSQGIGGDCCGCSADQVGQLFKVPEHIGQTA